MTTTTMNRETLTTRIGKLLAKAEATTSTAEAAALFEKAQQLASEHAIDMAVAAYEHASSQAPEVPEARTLVLSDGARRDGAHARVRLFDAVAKVNTVRYSIAADRSAVYPMGFPSDLDVVEQIFASLLEQMVRLSDEWVRSKEWQGDTYEVEVRLPRGYFPRTAWEARPVNARVARRLFQEQFVKVVRDRLRDAADKTLFRVEQAADASALSVMTLALRDRSEVVNEFTQAEYARKGVRGTYRGSRASSIGGNLSKDAGAEAGRNASMSGRRSIA